MPFCATQEGGCGWSRFGVEQKTSRWQGREKQRGHSPQPLPPNSCNSSSVGVAGKSSQSSTQARSRTSSTRAFFSSRCPPARHKKLMAFRTSFLLDRRENPRTAGEAARPALGGEGLARPPPLPPLLSPGAPAPRLARPSLFFAKLDEPGRAVEEEPDRTAAMPEAYLSCLTEGESATSVHPWCGEPCRPGLSSLYWPY